MAVSVPRRQLTEHRAQGQAGVLGHLGPQRIDSLDDIFKDLRRHGAWVREKVLVEQDATLDNVARLERFGPITALESLDGWAQLALRVSQRLLLGLVDLR